MQNAPPLREIMDSRIVKDFMTGRREQSADLGEIMKRWLGTAPGEVPALALLDFLRRAEGVTPEQYKKRKQA